MLGSGSGSGSGAGAGSGSVSVSVSGSERSEEAKQSKVKNFANYAKANRQKVNINIHLVWVEGGRGGGGREVSDGWGGEWWGGKGREY